MFVILLRILLLALIIYIIYRIFRYLLHPKRKLELAHEQKKFYFYDDKNNIRKNFLFTYNGVLFEGEKYLGTTDQAFDVISIFVWTKNTSMLKGLTYDDFDKIESYIRSSYPHAKIDWKSPIKEFLKKNSNEI